MANLKDIRTRIGSVKKTKQITSAMKLVAAAKLKGATDRALAAQPYQSKLRTVLGRVGAKAGDSVSDPLLQTHPTVEKVLLVMLTSDKGLCGGFNNNLLRRSTGWISERQASGVAVTVRTFGRKGRDFFKARGTMPSDAVIEYAKTPKMELVRPLSDHMVSGFINGDYDEVWIGYNHFANAAVQVPTFSKILPLTVEASEGAVEDASGDYLFEPDPGTILRSLLPLYLRTLLLQTFLESEAGEFGARMVAMDNASRNANDLIDRLSLQYNRARQAAITTEITEIVSGAEAL